MLVQVVLYQDDDIVMDKATREDDARSWGYTLLHVSGAHYILVHRSLQVAVVWGPERERDYIMAIRNEKRTMTSLAAGINWAQ